MRNGLFCIFKLFVAGIAIVFFIASIALMPPITLADERNSDIVVSKDNGKVSTFSQDKDNLMYDGKCLLAGEPSDLEKCLYRCVIASGMCKASTSSSSETCDQKEKECRELCFKKFVKNPDGS